MLYLSIKLIHILLAITAVGFNVSYGVWLARVSGASREVTRFALRGVKLMDDRIANPAYGLLLVTGLLMVLLPGGPWSLTTRWVDGALALFVVLILLGAIGYTPALRNQIRLLDEEGPESSAYQAAARRQTIIGVAFIPVLLAILFLMVFKPAA